MTGTTSSNDPDISHLTGADLGDRQARRVVWAFMLLAVSLPVADVVVRWTGGGPAEASSSIRRHVQSLLIASGGEGSHEVQVGGRGWLYSRAEMAALFRKPFRSLRAKEDHPVIALTRQLREQGVPLLLVQVPVKPSIYPENLSVKKFDAPVVSPDEAEVQGAIRSAGADLLDLTSEMWRLKLRKQVFLQQDNHWTPDAMKAMAEIVAKHIRTKYPQALKPPDETPVVNARLLDRSSFGNLVALLDPASPARLFPEEQVTLVSIVGLDPRPDAAISLIGGSLVSVFDDPMHGFATEEEATAGRRLNAGLGNQLSVLLNEPLDVKTTDGGVGAAFRAWSSRSEDEMKRKKLVVWVCSSQDLIQPW